MIADLDRLAQMVERLHEDNHTVAIITGGFDNMNLDHVDMLQFAKTKADVLVVGVDSDESLSISKGKRPLNPQERRLRMMDAIRCVDFVFPIRANFIFGSLESDTVHGDIIAQLKPDYLVTNPLTDAFYKHKLMRAKELGLQLIPFSNTPYTTISAYVQAIPQQLQQL